MISRGKGALLSRMMRESLLRWNSIQDLNEEKESAMQRPREKTFQMESRGSDQGSVCSEFREKVESGPGLLTEIRSKMGEQKGRQRRTLCRSWRSVLILHREVFAKYFGYIISFNLFRQSGRWMLFLLLEKKWNRVSWSSNIYCRIIQTIEK